MSVVLNFIPEPFIYASAAMRFSASVQMYIKYNLSLPISTVEAIEPYKYDLKC